MLNGALSNGHHVNGEQKADRERDLDGMSSTASETQVGMEYRFRCVYIEQFCYGVLCFAFLI